MWLYFFALSPNIYLRSSVTCSTNHSHDTPMSRFQMQTSVREPHELQLLLINTSCYAFDLQQDFPLSNRSSGFLRFPINLIFFAADTLQGLAAECKSARTSSARNRRLKRRERESAPRKQAVDKSPGVSGSFISSLIKELELLNWGQQQTARAPRGDFCSHVEAYRSLEVSREIPEQGECVHVYA